MDGTLGAVLPVFLVILLGLGLRLGRIVPDGFWQPAEKLTYFVTFPALLTANLAKADMGGLAWKSLMAVEALAVLAAAGLMIVLRRPMLAAGTSDPSFTSAFQGAIRPNTYVGLAVAAGLYGGSGVTLTAICIAMVVPQVNVLAVLCLSTLGQGQSASPWRLVKGILTNPLILACLLGILLNGTGIGLPPIVGPFLEILGRAALPIGLLAVGAGLALEGLQGRTLPLSLSTLAKLAVVPLLVWLGALVAGLDGMTTTLAVIYGALPCSASSYVLARRMGGDAPLMASIITVQTLLSAVTIPLVVLLLPGAG
ncbi:MAG: AEC family transporter [Rhodospirillum sp.]|nr:AEC family transporter [Rhodospirillum sp.]MCF8491557.1 AEC family transporter [Rhodospirillum sp.]MCF8501946.1 AEC family transporter [Rhodospirillum sp.]